MPRNVSAGNRDLKLFGPGMENPSGMGDQGYWIMIYHTTTVNIITTLAHQRSTISPKNKDQKSLQYPDFLNSLPEASTRSRWANYRSPWGSIPLFQKPGNHLFFFEEPVSHYPLPGRVGTLESKGKSDCKYENNCHNLLIY